MDNTRWWSTGIVVPVFLSSGKFSGLWLQSAPNQNVRISGGGGGWRIYQIPCCDLNWSWPGVRTSQIYLMYHSKSQQFQSTGSPLFSIGPGLILGGWISKPRRMTTGQGIPFLHLWPSVWELSATIYGLDFRVFATLWFGVGVDLELYTRPLTEVMPYSGFRIASTLIKTAFWSSNPPKGTAQILFHRRSCFCSFCSHFGGFTPS